MSNVVFYSIRPYPIFSNFSRSMINIIHLDPFWIPEKIYSRVIKRHALFLKNGGIEIPFFFFFKHVKHNHASSDYEIRDSVPVQSPRNIWGVDRRPNRTSANE